MTDTSESEGDQNVRWSFDIGSLHKDLPEEDDFTAMIRGHLYVEHVLIHFLQEALPRFELLQLDRLPFGTKLDLCAALTVVPEALIAPIKKVNQLRNRAAHNLHYRVSDQDKRDLLSLCDEFCRRLALEVPGKQSQVRSVETVPIAHFIRVFVVVVDINRQRYVKWKEDRQRAFENARRVLEEGRSNEQSP